MSSLQFALLLAPLFFVSYGLEIPYKGVSLDSQVLHFVPSLQDEYYCERVHVMGTSRLNVKYYASALRVTLKASEAIPEKLLQKIEVRSHRNASVGLCQFDNDGWKTLQKGQWSTVLSPYDNRYFDVRVNDNLPVAITITAEEDLQLWRLICLGIGFLLLVLAPIVSTWVPFYVCSSMAIGVLGVVLVISFQLMKLLPMGRKNILYITLYGSVLGVGSYIAQYFSSVVNSVLVGFGLSEEMHHPVSVFLLVWVIIAGAALGYWLVRKYIIAEDGSIDRSVAHFVKWAMRVIGVISVLQSSLDMLYPVLALGLYLGVAYLITSKKWRSTSGLQMQHSKRSLWQPRSVQSAGSSGKHTEFLSRTPNKGSGKRVLESPGTPYQFSKSNMRGTSNAYTSPSEQENYYSTFHKTPRRRRFSKTQWEDFTRESTREALHDWAASPEVAKWIAENANRIKLDDDDDYDIEEKSDDNSMESCSNSSDETEVEVDGTATAGVARLLKWGVR